MRMNPLTDSIGRQVQDLDLSQPMDDATFAELRRAWTEHCLLLFRGQRLSQPQLVAFSKRFGALEPPPASERSGRDGAGNLESPEVWTISNVIEDGKPIGSLGAGEAEWHTDMSYIERPPSASILYAVEIPADGGNTHFASMYAALQAMPARLRQAIEGRSAKHDSSYTSAGELRRGARDVGDAREAPGAVHPIVLRHPESRRDALYLGRRTNGYIDGLELADSEALLDELWDHCTRPDFAYKHDWQIGDVLVWDNRCTIHRRDAFDSSQRRVLYRTQVAG